MKMNKFNARTVSDAAAYTGGAVVGAMTSRVLYDKIPLKDEKEGETSKAKIKRGLLIAAGIATATMVDGKDTLGKVLQGAGAAMAATQANELIKELVNPTEGIMKVALGNPQVETVYVETYPALDASAFEQQKQPPFLAAANTTQDVSDVFSVV
ncbi:hypothetical protein [Capnocytophaga canimorsus]|uniref:hypothetical protein n=1 Tax=Capnocytophaga canimorsus TaxID=28188 RepID=UPI0037DD8BE5